MKISELHKSTVTDFTKLGRNAYDFYDCLFCTGIAINGNVETGDTFKESAQCLDCGTSFSTSKIDPKGQIDRLTVLIRKNIHKHDPDTDPD